MRLKYKAIKSTGEKYEGVIESAGKFDLYNQLKAEGDMLISAEEINKFNLDKYLYKFELMVKSAV